MKEYHFTSSINEFTFSDLSELLSHFQLDLGHIFSCGVPQWRAGEVDEPNWVKYKSNVYVLMDSATYKKWCWVLGYTDFPLNKYLPHYSRVKVSGVVVDVNCSDQEILDFVQGRLSCLHRAFKPRSPLPCVVRLIASNKRIVGSCTLTEVRGSEWILTEFERIEEYRYVKKRPVQIRYVK